MLFSQTHPFPFKLMFNTVSADTNFKSFVETVKIATITPESTVSFPFLPSSY